MTTLSAGVFADATAVLSDVAGTERDPGTLKAAVHHPGLDERHQGEWLNREDVLTQR
jgi:hypothetical protein